MCVFILIKWRRSQRPGIKQDKSVRYGPVNIFLSAFFFVFISVCFCFWQFLFRSKNINPKPVSKWNEREIEKEQITPSPAAIPVITTTAYAKTREEKKRTNERTSEQKGKKSIERCSTGFHASPERNTKMANNTWCENSFTKFILYSHRMMMMMVVLVLVVMVTIGLEIRARTPECVVTHTFHPCWCAKLGTIALNLRFIQRKSERVSVRARACGG